MQPAEINFVAVSTSMLYRLSHATVYINYDGYATYSMTFKPKAKFSCQKTRGYVKIGAVSQQGLAKIFFEFSDYDDLKN